MKPFAPGWLGRGRSSDESLRGRMVPDTGLMSLLSDVGPQAVQTGTVGHLIFIPVWNS